MAKADHTQSPDCVVKHNCTTHRYDPEDYQTLPGRCTVQNAIYSSNGIVLTKRLLSPFGFSAHTPARVLVTEGYLVITTRPELTGMLKGIEELQLRQDEAREDFTDAIKVLLHQFVK